MKKYIALLLSLALVLTVFAGCQSQSSGTATTAAANGDTAAATGEAVAIPDGKVTLRIGTSASDTSAITQGAQWFADKMNERTGGLVTVKVYPSDSISGGAQAKGIEMLMDGSADMTFHSNLIYSTLDEPSLDV